jgi:hypothetical protein
MKYLFRSISDFFYSTQRDSVTRFLTSGFRQSITPRPQMNTLKYFRILFRIRWQINENVLIPRYAA